jgi:hypothetical protein
MLLTCFNEKYLARLPACLVISVPLSVVLGASGSLRLLSILTIHSDRYPRPCRL